MSNTDNSQIAETETPEGPPEPGLGVAHESLIETVLHTGEHVIEKIVHEFDGAGNVIGAHKEPHNG